MSVQRCFWIVLAAAHLVIVVCGASGCLPGPNGGAPAHLLRWHAKLSGADSHYGFYAPEVGSEFRARFVLEDHRGATWSGVFEEAQSAEARLRQQGIIHWGFVHAAEEQSLEQQQRLVKSWAATMFTRHPGATALGVRVEVYDIPTMAEYRAGRRADWKVLYQARVKRASHVAHERAEP